MVHRLIANLPCRLFLQLCCTGRNKMTAMLRTRCVVAASLSETALNMPQFYRST